VWSVLV